MCWKQATVFFLYCAKKEVGPAMMTSHIHAAQVFQAPDKDNSLYKLLWNSQRQKERLQICKARECRKCAQCKEFN